MIAVAVRRGSETATIHANTVEELYTNTARHFHIADELTLRLVFRARVLQRTDTFADHHITDGSVVMMTVGNSTPVAPHGTSSTDSPNQQRIPTIQFNMGDLSSLPINEIINGVIRSVSGAVGNNLENAGALPGPTVVIASNASQVFPEAASPPPATDSPSQVPVEGVPLASSSNPSGTQPRVVPIVPQRRVLSQLSSQPPIAGVYLHLHVNMNELDSVPEQLERLQRRASSVSSIPISVNTNRVHFPAQFPSNGPSGTSPAVSVNISTAPPARPPGKSPAAAAPGFQPTGATYVARERQEDREPEPPVMTFSSSLRMLRPVIDRISSIGFDSTRFLTMYMLQDSSQLFPHRSTIREAWELFKTTVGQQLFRSFITENRVSFGLREDLQLQFVLDQVIDPWTKELDDVLTSILNLTEADGGAPRFAVLFNSMLGRYIGGLLYFLSNVTSISNLTQILQENIQREPEIPPALKGPFLTFLPSVLPRIIESYNSTHRRENDPVLLSLPTQCSSNEKSSPPQGINDDSLNALADSLLNSGSDEDSTESIEEENSGPQIAVAAVWAVDTENTDAASYLGQVLETDTTPLQTDRNEYEDLF